MVVVGMDMGVCNCAYAFSENGKILKTGKIENLLTDFTTNYNIQIKKFKREMQELTHSLNKEDVLLIERFQIRKFNPGSQIELVSAMLGLVSGVVPCRVVPVIAGTWKNWFLKTYKENQMELFFQTEIDSGKFDEHVSDAIGMCIWYQESVLNEKFDFFKDRKIQDSCLVCWRKLHGCLDKKLCGQFVRYDKLVKCGKCLHSCAPLRDAKKYKISKTTFGCVKWEAKK